MQTYVKARFLYIQWKYIEYRESRIQLFHDLSTQALSYCSHDPRVGRVWQRAKKVFQQKYSDILRVNTRHHTNDIIELWKVYLRTQYIWCDLHNIAKYFFLLEFACGACIWINPSRFWELLHVPAWKYLNCKAVIVSWEKGFIDGSRTVLQIWKTLDASDVSISALKIGVAHRVLKADRTFKQVCNFIHCNICAKKVRHFQIRTSLNWLNISLVALSKM